MAICVTDSLYVCFYVVCLFVCVTDSLYVCFSFSLFGFSLHGSDTLGISTPLQSRKDIVSIAPFNLNIVPADKEIFWKC